VNTSIGHVVFGGRHFPVTSLELTGGAIRITWEIAGPCPGGTHPVTVFGQDGQGVAQAGSHTVPDVPDHTVLVLTNIWIIGGVTDL
jgi:hypothetical protein